MADRMLTTTDNPYDPFTQFDEWYALDRQLGYNCCAIVDRVSMESPLLTEEENEELYNEALDEIVKENVFGVFKIVESK